VVRLVLGVCGAAQPGARRVVSNHRVARYTGAQGPLLLLPAVLLLGALPLPGGLPRLLGGRGGEDVPPVLGVAVGGARRLLVVRACREGEREREGGREREGERERW